MLVNKDQIFDCFRNEMEKELYVYLLLTLKWVNNKSTSRKFVRNVQS